MTLQMKITRECGRCGKKKELECDMERVQEFIETDKAREQALKEVMDFTASLGEEHPDIIILRRNGKEYEVDTLSELCSNLENAKRFRGCEPRVQNLIDDIMNRTVRKPSKPKNKPKDKPKTAPPKGNGKNGKN